jgi:hypothetical protein
MARPLNNATREHIEDSVIKATFIPAKKEAIIASAKVAVREHLMALLPAEFLPATATLPDSWFDHEEREYMRNEVNPEAILFWDRDSSLMDSRKAGRWMNLSFEPFRKPYHYSISVQSTHDKKNPDVPSWEKILATQIDQAEKLAAEENTLREEVRAVLFSVKSVEKLLEKMPEFARHVPPAPAKYALPVVSTVKVENLLKKVGFDQGVES